MLTGILSQIYSILRRKAEQFVEKYSAKYKQEYYFHVNYVQNKADLGVIVKILENESQEDTENNATIDRYFSVDHLGPSETVGHHIQGGERDNAVIVFEVIGEWDACESALDNATQRLSDNGYAVRDAQGEDDQTVSALARQVANSRYLVRMEGPTVSVHRPLREMYL